MTGKSNKSKNAKKKEPARIESITLKNAACFEDITIPFKERISVLVGPNGTGKTTVLNALVGSIIYSWIQEDYPQEGYKLNRMLPLSKSTAPKNPLYYSLITVRSNTDKFDYKFQNRNLLSERAKSWGHSAISTALSELLTIPIIPISGFRKPLDEKLEGVKPLYKRETSTTNTSDAFPNPNEDPQFLIEYVDLMTSNLREFRAQNMKQWLVNLDYESLKGKDSSKRQLKHFTSNIGKLMPKDMKLEYKDVDINYKEPIFITNTGETPIGAFSSGFQSILSIYWNILYFLQGFYPDSPNPFEEPGIAIIDELDAHLHPEWQQVILNGLRKMFPNVQFIVATHSPLIVSGCKPGEAIFLKYDVEKKSVILDKKKDSPTGWTAGRILKYLFNLSSDRDSEWANELEWLNKKVSNRDAKGIVDGGITDTDIERIRNIQSKLNLPSTDPYSDLLDEEIMNRILEGANAQGKKK